MFLKGLNPSRAEGGGEKTINHRGAEGTGKGSGADAELKMFCPAGAIAGTSLCFKKVEPF